MNKCYNNNNSKHSSYIIIFWITIVVFTVITICSISLFCRERYVDINAAVDTSIWSSFGDFFGGTIGTVVSLFSVCLLILTLRNQIESNERIGYQTNLQLFDNKFVTFLKIYRESIENYSYSNLVGREAFVKLMQDFSKSNFNNRATYLLRSDAARKRFEILYADNCYAMSVHTRMLYQLISLISRGDISDRDRYIYAKCVRAQLCDEELLLIRYDCLSKNGYNMQQFVVRYNLLKHLPVLSLLEFKYWRGILQGNSNYINSINSHFLRLKKKITNILKPEGFFEDPRFIVSDKYSINVDRSPFSKEVFIILQKNKNRGPVGAVGIPIIEKAFDLFSDYDLIGLYIAFFKEFFQVSNFYRFAGRRNDLRMRYTTSSTKDYDYVYFTIERDTPIVVSIKQLDKNKSSRK